MSDWKDFARLAACERGVDPRVFGAMIGRESGWRPDALAEDGAAGIAQLMPRAHPSVDPWNPPDALRYAASMMAQLLDRYGGRYDLALAAYNGSVASPGGTVPGPSRAYVINVLADTVAGEVAGWMCPTPEATRQVSEPPSALLTPTPTPTPPALFLLGVIVMATLARPR